MPAINSYKMFLYCEYFRDDEYNQTFGDFAVFLVPIEQQDEADKAQIVYQALFN